MATARSSAGPAEDGPRSKGVAGRGGEGNGTAAVPFPESGRRVARARHSLRRSSVRFAHGGVDR